MPSTPILGLIGRPLSHSFSPAYFQRKWEALGLTHLQYGLFPLETIEELPALLKAQPQLWGFNVTIPYKRAVLPFLDELSEEARAIGAVNVVDIRAGGRLTGYNTDAYGFRAALEERFPDFRPERALVLGTGGASRAVCFALRQMGVHYAKVSRRARGGEAESSGSGRGVSALFSSEQAEAGGESGEQVLTYEALEPELLREIPLIVNTTPLGMHPLEEGLPPIPYEALGPQHLLYDLIYRPAETRFLARGRLAGARVLNGLRMLELQADASWRIWSKGRIFGLR